MAFDNKFYPNRKDNRRVYTYNIAKRCDRSCRNHGTCAYCLSNRTIHNKRREVAAKDAIRNLD